MVAKTTINGITYTGNNITVQNNRVYVDGVLAEAKGDSSGEIRIVVVEGCIHNLITDGSVRCGNVMGDISAGGSVDCNVVGGSVRADGSVNCDDVGTSVSAGGSVNCDDVGGSVSAGGSVRRG